jgi:hypothetical protein
MDQEAGFDEDAGGGIPVDGVDGEVFDQYRLFGKSVLGGIGGDDLGPSRRQGDEALFVSAVAPKG